MFGLFLLQVCRNINRIKVCMETGSTVILLNLENLYESLYDALNQVKYHCMWWKIPMPHWKCIVILLYLKKLHYTIMMLLRLNCNTIRFEKYITGKEKQWERFINSALKTYFCPIKTTCYWKTQVHVNCYECTFIMFETVHVVPRGCQGH